MLNKVILIGHLGADPEIRAMQSGDKVASLRLATSERWKDKNTGERKERTEWHRVTVFNQNLVRVVEQYARKGSKLYIEGTIQTRKYQDQSGADRYLTEIVLQNFNGTITLLDSGGGGERPAPEPDNYGTTRNRDDPRTMRNTSNADQKSYDLDDDIPF